MKLVSALLLDSANVNAVLTKLEDHFGKPEMIYNGLLREVLSLRPPRFEVPKSIIDFISGVGNLVITMKSLNREEYLNDQRLLEDLANKLPATLNQKWLMHLNEEKILSSPSNPFIAPTLVTFFEWLKPQETLANMLIAEEILVMRNSGNHKKIY